MSKENTYAIIHFPKLAKTPLKKRPLFLFSLHETLNNAKKDILNLYEESIVLDYIILDNPISGHIIIDIIFLEDKPLAVENQIWRVTRGITMFWLKELEERKL